MRQDTSLFTYGTQGNNVAANTAVATLAVPTAGRYRVWGMARHTLADGLKFTSPIAMIICSGPNDTAMFGPFIVDMAAAGNIVIQLNTATGAADTAAANLYAERINQ